MSRALIVAVCVSLVTLPALVWLRFDARPASALPVDPRFAQLAAFLENRESVVLMACESDVALDGLAEFGELITGATADDAVAIAEQALALWPSKDVAELDALFANVDARAAELRERAAMPGGRALLTQAQRDPLGLGAALLAKLKQQGGVTVGADMRLHAGACRIAFLVPREPSSNRAFTRALAAAIPAGVNATGPHLYAAEYDERISQGLWRAGVVSIGVVIAICFVLFRDLLAMLLIGVTLALAGGWTMGAAAIVLGKLHVLAVSAASILPAVGIDAGIHFYTHRRMTRPIYVAAFASALGFATLLFARTPAFQQFGALLALGVFFNTLAMATVLPLLFRWVKPRAHADGIVERLGDTVGRAPRIVSGAILAAALVTLVVLYRAPEERLGFSALVDPSLKAAQSQRVFERIFGATDKHVFIVSEGATEDDAIDAQKHIEVADVIEGGPLLWVTANDKARAEQLRERLQPAKTAARLRQALEAQDLDASFFDWSMLESLGTKPWRPPALARLAHRQRVGPSGDRVWALTSIFVRGEQMDPRYVGPAVLDAQLRTTLKADGRLLAILAAVAVVGALIISRMQLRRTIAVVTALVLILAFLWLSFGAFAIPLTLVTILAVPFVLGIGIDASVYLAEHDAFTQDKRRLLREHLRPLLASTLTTLAGFVSLTAVPLEQISLLGVSVALGLGWALVIALLWIPMLAPSKL